MKVVFWLSSLDEHQVHTLRELNRLVGGRVSFVVARRELPERRAQGWSLAEVSDLVVEEITTNPVSLIEKLAGRIAERIKQTYAQAALVTVTVHKPQAPVSADVKDISVTISR